MWSVYLFELRTGRLGAKLKVESADWSVSLNEIENFKVVCSKSALPPLPDEWFTPWWVGILLVYGDTPIVGGPLLSIPQEDLTSIQFEAKGIRRVLVERLVTHELQDWNDLAKSVVSFKGLSLGTIAKRIVQQAQLKPGGALPISYPVPDETSDMGVKIPSGLAYCAVEDGSYGPNPCYWDANLLGNGQGRSFAIIGGEFIYPSDNNHQRNYKGFNISNISADKLLTEIANVSRGPDVMFKPRFINESYVTFDLWTGTEADPRIYQKNMPLWDTTNTKSNVIAFSLTKTGAYQANRVYASGAGTDESIKIVVVTNESPLSAGFPLLEKVTTAGNSEDMDVIRSQAKSNLYQNTKMLMELTLVVRGDGSIPIGQFWPGDKVELIVKGMKSIPDGKHSARLLNMSGTLSTNVRLSLQMESKKD